MKCSSALFLLPTLLRTTIAYTELSESTLKSLPRPGADFDIKTGSLLAPILQTRVPGTPGSEAVLYHFIDFFASELPQWHITFQNSSQVTPTSGGKPVPFTNLIATRDPPWVKSEGEVGRLALVAHYDSKLTPEGFIGATDSAAPCAMILHAAKSIDAALTAKWDAMAAAGKDGSDDLDDEEGHKGIQILLLDGEEAFQTWTSTDSLYGARSLAEEWENTMHPAMSTYRNPLGSIDLFVLLDLLGSQGPRVPSYFKTTHWAYQRMAGAESRLRKASLLETKDKAFFHEASKKEDQPWMGGYVEDDHVPFMARGVEVLHIIPNPFPKVWHTIEDDGEHLDIPTCEDWAVITAAFAAEWMDLEGHFDTKQQKRDKQDAEEREHEEL